MSKQNLDFPEYDIPKKFAKLVDRVILGVHETSFLSRLLCFGIDDSGGRPHVNYRSNYGLCKFRMSLYRNDVDSGRGCLRIADHSLVVGY